MKVTYFDVFNRQRDLSSLNESLYDSTIPSKNFDLYFERYKNTKDVDNFLKAIRECSNAIIANDNIFNILEAYNDMEDDSYDKKLIENKIINNVIPYTNRLNAKNFAETPFYEAVRMTNVEDRLNENHNMLKDKYNYDAYNKANETNRISFADTCILFEICSTIDKTNLPTQGKIVTSLEEFYLAMGKNNRHIDSDKVILEVITFFTANKPADWNRIQNTLNNSIVLEFTNFTDDNGLCHITNSQEFDGLIQKCFDSSTNSYEGMDKYGDMTRAAVLGGDKEFVSDIISKVPGELCKTILSKDNINKSEIVKAVYSLDNKVNENTYIIKMSDNQDIKTKLTHLNEAYNKAIDNLKETERIINTGYNNYCLEGKLDEITGKMMSAKQVFDKGLSKVRNVTDIVKSNVDKVKSKIPKIKYEPKNIVTLIMKADRALADKFKRAKIAGLEKVNNIRSKIFSEVYVYDFLAENGNIDVLLYTIEAEDKVDNITDAVELEICRFLNEQVLNGSGYRTYYVCSENQIDIHMTTDIEAVELTESDIEESQHYLSESTMEYMYDLDSIMEDLDSTHFATTQETIDFFTNNPDKDLFKSYCELASLAGYDKDSIDDIGMYITTEDATLTDEIERIVSEYTVEEDVPLYVQLEAIDIIADLIVEGDTPSPTHFSVTLINPAEKLKNKWRYKKSKLRKMKRDLKAVSFSPSSFASTPTKEFALLEVDFKDAKNNNSNTNNTDNKKVDPNKDKEGNKKISNDNNEEKNLGDKIKDGVKQVGDKVTDVGKKVGDKAVETGKKVKAAVGGALKEINLNNLQLAINALRKSAKDMSAKEQEVSRNADAAFNYFIKSCKELLVSDRREAIIKGSVIPSFSKCIKIGLGLIGVGILTGGPLIPAIMLIGGIGISKDLTKKERALLIDDIETELDVIEKQMTVYENSGQMKKYKAALKIKKELQRQQARIQYNIRIGKDFIPGPSGVTTRKNEE